MKNLGTVIRYILRSEKYGAYLSEMDWDGPVFSKIKDEAFKFSSYQEAEKYHTHDINIVSVKFSMFECCHEHITVTEKAKGQFTAKCLECGMTTDRPKMCEMFAVDWLKNHPAVNELRS